MGILLRMIKPSAYFLIFLSLSIFEGYSKKYLIETDEGTLKKKKEHGKDYYGGYAPKPYGHSPSERECGFESWGSWGSQSVTCGPGTQTRRRDCRCSDGTTYGCSAPSQEETKQFDNGPCYTCAYGSWTQWSRASVTCATSTSTRTRRCTCTDGVSRTSECSGPSTEPKEIDHGPCTTKWVATTTWKAPVWTPKPYRGKKRRMKKRRRM